MQITYDSKRTFDLTFCSYTCAGCWSTLPHHGHNQEEEGGAEGGGDQTERGGGIPQQDQQRQTTPQTSGADSL